MSVHVWVCVLGHYQPTNQKVVGLIPGVTTLVLLLFLEQETLLTLLQSTQLYKWEPGVN